MGKMLTFIEATDKASAYLKDMKTTGSIDLILLIDETIEFKYGWAFFYQATKYIETKNILYALGGNAPIIINKFNGALSLSGTGKPIEKYIEEYIKNQEL